jgi:hypothetical protein
VTNAVSVLGTYPDPAWIPSLAWTKLIGTPATFTPAAHTHDAAAIVSGQIATARLGAGVADASVYLRGDGLWAAAGSGGGGGVISVFGRAGTVIATAGDYTAAQVTGAVIDPTSIKGDLLVRNDLSAIVRLPVGASGQVLQADNTLTVGMKWTSITGAVQTPWVTDVDAAFFALKSAGFVGVGLTSAIQTTAGRRYLAVRGSTGSGVVELSQADADADGVVVGHVQFADTNSTAPDKRIATMLASTDGPTAGNRGGAIRFFTKPDGVSAFVERMRIANNGSIVQSIPAAAVADALLATNAMSIWYDEAGNRLVVRVKSSASVLKTGFIAVS